MEYSAEPDSQAVVICGFGELGQTLANMLESPLAVSLERGRVPYVAFDLQPSRMRSAREAGFNVFYGDASRPAVRLRPPPPSRVGSPRCGHSHHSVLAGHLRWYPSAASPCQCQHSTRGCPTECAPRQRLA
jgi:hypothetical protein